MSAAGTYARIPMGEAFDVMCQELDDIVNRMCGIDEVALAYAWMNKHSMKVPEFVKLPCLYPLPDGRRCCECATCQPTSTGLGDGVAVGQAAGSGSAATNGEPERAALSPSLVRGQGAAVPEARQPRSAPSPRRWCTRCGGEYDNVSVHGPGYCGLVGEPSSPTGTDSPEDASLGTDASRKHGGGSPTRHLSAVPEEAA